MVITVDGLPEGVWSMKMYDSQGREVLNKDISNGDFISIWTVSMRGITHSKLWV